MAIITPEIYAEWANIQLAPGELQSVQVLCGQIDKAIKNRLKRTLEQQTFTGLILDAPTTPNITLGRYAPITISDFQCYYDNDAQGDPSAFTSDDLLTMYTDYMLDVDRDTPTLSPGNLKRVGAIWGIQYRWRPYGMTPQFDPNYGSIKLTFQGGYADIPDDIVAAACIAMSQMLGNRKYGYQIGSESWNGYSYNIPGVGLLANGTLGSPDILGLLEPYVNYESMLG
jgi:hypothetical protein